MVALFDAIITAYSPGGTPFAVTVTRSPPWGTGGWSSRLGNLASAMRRVVAAHLSSTVGVGVRTAVGDWLACRLSRYARNLQ